MSHFVTSFLVEVHSQSSHGSYGFAPSCNPLGRVRVLVANGRLDCYLRFVYGTAPRKNTGTSQRERRLHREVKYSEPVEVLAVTGPLDEPPTL